MNLNKALRGIKLYQEVKDKNLITLSFGVYNGTLRAYINKMSSNRKDNQLVFSFGIVTANARLISEELLKVIDMKEVHDTTFILKGAKFVDNQIVEGETVLTAKVTIKKAKNKQGKLINIFQVTSPTEQVYRFILLPTPFLEVMVNGELVKDDEILTEKITTAFAKNYTAMVDLLPEGLEEEKPKQNLPRY